MSPVIPDSVEKGNPGDNLILYGFGGANDTVGSLSPYVGKVETYLRMNDIPYEAVELKTGVGKSPKKLAPYIEHGKVLLSDSTFILRYLENTYAGKLKVKTHTDPLKRGIAVAVQRLCEDHLTYGVVWHRWFDNEGFAGFRKILFKGLPFPLSASLPRIFRKRLIKRSFDQGFGKHSRKDVITLLETSVEALSGLLGTSNYITGDEPCPQDCIVFAILDLYLNSKVIQNDPLRILVMKYLNLVSYVKRIEKEYFPEDNPSGFRMEKC